MTGSATVSMEGWKMIKTFRQPLHGHYAGEPGRATGDPGACLRRGQAGGEAAGLCRRARTYAAIYAVPEKVLDLLAVELRTPSYDENFSIKVKRTLIAESLLFYAQMGTPQR